MSRRFWGLLAIAIAAAVAAGAAATAWWLPRDRAIELSTDWSAVVGVTGDEIPWSEPFGVAVGDDRTLVVTDGASGNRVLWITLDGHPITTIGAGEAGFADGPPHEARFNTPSGVARDRSGNVFVADTANNAIRRITPDGQVTTLATGLNGPVGIAVHDDGRIVVADTYSDRLVTVDHAGVVTPLAVSVELDTPTGLAIDKTGTIYVADTGHNVVHAIAPGGSVTTLEPLEAGGFSRPIGLAVDERGSLFVTDADARVIEVPPSRLGARVVAGSAQGFRNGRGEDAQFRRPTGIAVLAPGRLVVTDSGNALLRTITAVGIADAVPPPSPRLAPRFDPASFSETPLLWPLDPLTGPFEIAGTLGEARGEDAGRFHAGIDVRAEQGTDVLAIRDGVVTLPLSTGDFGSLNEWLRIGELTYVHLRAGRTRRGDLIDPDRFVVTRDERNRITRVRVKRGARFRTGETIGSVNAFNHVHLNVGWGGEEYNPLLFRLVQFEDTVAPTIARGGIRLIDAEGVPLVTRVKGRLLVSGSVQVIVDAWDQADGNHPNRRLGVYALGYQLLNADGTPAPGFAQPLETITFNRLGTPEATRLVYAPGSGIPFYGQRRTRFLYVVTNRFRDGVAEPGVWDAAALPPGDYTLRVKVADINGNEAIANRDLAVTVTGRERTAGG